MPFAGLPDDQLLSYGVPVEWLPDIHAADEDSILELASHLPNEAAEALLELAVGETLQAPSRVPVGVTRDLPRRTRKRLREYSGTGRCSWPIQGAISRDQQFATFILISSMDAPEHSYKTGLYRQLCDLRVRCVNAWDWTP